MTHVLLVEDERGLAITIRDRFRAHGFHVEVESDGDAGLERAMQASHDLLVLDVMLPGISGFEIVRKMRVENVETPVLILTARGDTTDRIVGLKLGADDYLPKPFDMGELLARAEALLRRSHGGGARLLTEVSFPDFRIVFCNSLLEPAGGEVCLLPPRETELLRTLVATPGRIWSRDELLKRVWRLSPETWTRTVDVHVASLRRKLEPDPRRPRYILTVAGAGYQFNPAWR